jgi:hypothetical protein
MQPQNKIALICAFSRYRYIGWWEIFVPVADNQKAAAMAMLFLTNTRPSSNLDTYCSPLPYAAALAYHNSLQGHDRVLSGRLQK